MQNGDYGDEQRAPASGGGFGSGTKSSGDPTAPASEQEARDMGLMPQGGAGSEPAGEPEGADVPGLVEAEEDLERQMGERPAEGEGDEG